MRVPRPLPIAIVVLIVVALAALSPLLVRRIAFAVESGQQAAAAKALPDLSRRDALSTLFQTVAQAVKPAVVEVRVSKSVELRGAPFSGHDFFRRFFDLPDDELRRRFPEPRQREFVQRGLGSGFVADAENGHVLTNHHVVGSADRVTIVLADRRRLEAEWVRTDPQTDLAVVKVDPSGGLIAASLGDSDRMKVGDLVLAIGSPRGLPHTVTAGIISAKGRTTGAAEYTNFLQTDAAINQDNSGGPLVNTRGEVIGINNSILSMSGGSEGIGFAIPSNMARGIVEQLVDTGRVVRGYIGVTIQNVSPKLARSFDLPHTRGALIATVVPGGPADKAGLESGDFVTEIDGKAVTNVNDLRNRVAAIEPGTAAEFRVHRKGEPQTVTVTIARRPTETAAGPGAPPPAEATDQASRFGLRVATMHERYARRFGYAKVPDGVVILAVDPQSSAAEEGLRAGMVVTQVQDNPVGSVEQFNQALAGADAANGVRLRVRTPDGAGYFVFISPGED